MKPSPVMRKPLEALVLLLSPREREPSQDADPAWYRWLRFVCIWACLAFATANAALLLTRMAHAAAPTPCEDDGLHSVRGAGECLVIHTQGAAAADGRTVLLVFVHGDNSGGGPSDPYVERGARFAVPGTVVVTLIRPGYFDRHGRHSTGTSHRFTGDGYRPEVVDAVGDAIARLRQRHEAQRAVVAGVSGGAAIAGVLLGRMPGLIDAAVLSGCPCDVQRWRELRGSGHWRRSLSPHRFVQQVPPATHVLVVTGERDANTPPVLGRDYALALQAAGVDAHFILAAGATHPQAGRGPAFLAAVASALQHVHADLSKT